MSKFTGLGVAMVTPFTSDREVDVPALQKLTHHLIDNGVDVLVVLGTTAESATLTDQEKDLVIRTVMGENQGRKPVVLGCGGNFTQKIVKELKEMEERYSPDAFLSVAPYYNKPTQEGLYQHFNAICQASSTPIVLYNVPGRTASNLMPDTALRIARDNANAIAIKEASGSLEQGMKILASRREDFLVLSGDDILTLPMIGAGYDGVTSVIGNAYPELFSRLVHQALDGNFAEARQLQSRLLNMMNLIFEEGNPAGVKALLKELGICGAYTRLPLVPASDELRHKIREEHTRIHQAATA